MHCKLPNCWSESNTIHLRDLWEIKPLETFRESMALIPLVSFLKLPNLLPAFGGHSILIYLLGVGSLYSG